MDDSLQELIDLFYYHVIVGTERLDKALFKDFLKMAPQGSREGLEKVVDGLLGRDEGNSAWDLIADIFFQRVKDIRDGGVLLTSVISSLVAADLRFSTEVARLFALRCFQIDRFKQAVLDILTRIALEKETTDASMFRYAIECMDAMGLDEEKREVAFIMLARNLRGESGHSILVGSGLLPREPDNVLSVFSVCDPACTRVLLQGLSQAEEGARILAQLVGAIVQQPGPAALGGLGKLYMCAPDDPTGEEARARARASVVLVAERLGHGKSIEHAPVSVDLIVGLSLSLGLDSAKGNGLVDASVNGIIELIEKMRITEYEYPAFSQAVISILSQITVSEPEILQMFVTRVSSIAGRLYTALRSPETQRQARVSFRVLQHIIESQSKIGRPLPQLRAIMDNYTKMN